MSNRTEFSQSDIESFHWVKFNGQNGEVLYALSGIIFVNMTGSSPSWLQLPVTCKIDLPELPPGQGLFALYWTPFAALNSIFDKNVANNGGHGVNSFNLVSVHPNGTYGSKDITLSLDLAVADSDAVLYKVGFNITLTGVFRPLPPVDPCQAEQDAYNSIQQLCGGGYQQQIDVLQGIFEGAPPEEKAGIRSRMDFLQLQLDNCPITLPLAQSALTACRLKHPSGGTRVPPILTA